MPIPWEIASLFLFITLECNIGCPWCYSGCGATLSTSSKLSKQVLDRLYNMISTTRPPRHLFIFGGEPLLYPDVVLEAVTKFKDLLPYVLLNTNGILLDSRMVSLLVENGVDYFILSVGKQEDTDLVALKNLSSVSKQCPTSVILVVTPSNLGRVEELLDSVLKTEVNRVSIYPIVNAEWNKASLEEYHSILPRLGNKLGEWTAETGKIWQERRFGRPLTRFTPVERCSLLKRETSMIVCSPSGNLFLCPRLVRVSPQGEEDLFGCIGNVFQGEIDVKAPQSIVDILSRDFPCNVCPLKDMAIAHEMCCPITFRLLAREVGLVRAKFILCSLHKGFLSCIRNYFSRVRRLKDRYIEHVRTYCNYYDCSSHLSDLELTTIDSIRRVGEYEKLYYDKWESENITSS